VVLLPNYLRTFRSICRGDHSAPLALFRFVHRRGKTKNKIAFSGVQLVVEEPHEFGDTGTDLRESCRQDGDRY
jgi:hypothetical protein